MATLSRRDVEHVAHLARLGLDDEEIALFQEQLNHILDQYAVLSELDTDAIPPTAQTIELENILREDLVRPGFDVSTALANAPERSGDHFVVPAVLGGDETDATDARAAGTEARAAGTEARAVANDARAAANDHAAPDGPAQ